MFGKLFRRKQEFIDWETYRQKIEISNALGWQKHARRRSMMA